MLTMWSALLVWGLTPWRSCSRGETSREAWLSLRRSMNTASFCRAKSKRHKQCNTADSRCFLPVRAEWCTLLSEQRHKFSPFPNSGACFLTGERCIGVQLADPLLQQAEAECQHGRVIEQVEHDAVARRLMGRDLLTLQLHNLLDKVRRLGLVVPQQLVEHLEDRVGYLPLEDGNEIKCGGTKWADLHTVKSESMFRVYTSMLGGSITFSAGRRYALVGKGRNTESRKKFK